MPDVVLFAIGVAVVRPMSDARVCAQYVTLDLSSWTPDRTTEHGIHNRISSISVPEDLTILQITAAFPTLIGRSRIDTIDAFHARILGQVGEFDRSKSICQLTSSPDMKHNRKEQVHDDESSQLTARLIQP